MNVQLTDDPSVLLDFDREALSFGDQVRVRFRIGAVDLLGTAGAKPDTLEPWLRLLVPEFAAFGMACLHVIEKEGRAALELDDYAQELLFQMTGAQVLVWSTRLGNSAQVRYSTLFDAWMEFGETVRRACDQHPKKRAYGWWTLLSEYPPPNIVEYLTRPSWFEESEE